MSDFSQRQFAQKAVWLVAGVVVILAGVVWKPITTQLHRANGYKYLNQALEILGDQNPEPDFCVEGGIAEPKALELVQRGVKELAVAHDRTPTDAQTLLLLGRGYCLLGRVDKAIETYNEYIELRPGNPAGHLELGFAYEQKGRSENVNQEWKKASITYDQLLEVGEIKQSSESYAQAQLWYERALLVDPRNLEAWYRIGFVKEQQSDLSGALEAYKKAVPGNLNAYYGIGRIYKSSNELALALDIYKIITEIETVPVEAYVEIGQIEEKSGNFEEALVAYQLATQYSKMVQGNRQEATWKRVWPLYLMGNLYLRLDNLAEARASFEKALMADPLNFYSSWSLWGLGRIAVLEERLVDALAYLNQALEFRTNYYVRSQVYFQISNIYRSEGNLHACLIYLLKAHQEHPENKGLHLLYAETLVEVGHFQEGVSEYKNYLIKWPDDPSVKKKLFELEKLLNNEP